MNPPAYTAAHYAAIIGVSKRRVSGWLEEAGAPASRKELVRGQEASVWEFTALPGCLQKRLIDAWRNAESATGCQPWRDLAHFLADPPPPPSQNRTGLKPENPGLKPTDRAAWQPGDFSHLKAELALITDTHTPGELSYFWHCAFETLETAVAQGRPESKFKRALFRWLHEEAPFLAVKKSQFYSLIHRWRCGGRNPAAIQDRRAEANQRRRKVIPKADLDAIEREALNAHDGDMAKAYRMCQKRGELSPACQHYTTDPADKSYVPEAIRREAAPEVRILLPWLQRPRWAEANGAHIISTWKNLCAGDVFSSDDVTLEVVWAGADGKPTRGQFLPYFDVRSKKILTAMLIPEKNYNGMHIRSLIIKGSSEIGLPHLGWLFESGIWEKSQLVAGSLPCGDVRANFATRLGRHIRNCLPGHARGKSGVENAIGRFQEHLRDLPGWVGPNEQVRKIEAAQAAKLDVEAGRKTPEEAGLMTYEQFWAVLCEKIQIYNATPQDSIIMSGTEIPVRMSPNEAWEKFQRRDEKGEVRGLDTLPDDCRYLLNSHIFGRKVTRNGIKLADSLGGGTYRSRDLMAHEGYEVTVLYDLECLDSIAVKTREGVIMTVPRLQPIPAFGAAREQISKGMAEVREIAKDRRARVAELKHGYMPPKIPIPCADAETIATGRFINEQREEQKAAEKHSRDTLRRGSRAAAELGLDQPASPRAAEMAQTLADLFKQ